MKLRELEHQRAVALPRYGEYNCAFKYILQVGLRARCVVPPPVTRRTIQLGAAASPDTVCMPYKTLAGSMIEALENGAQVLIMSGGECRLSYFGELMDQTLHDMGYEFEFINLQPYLSGDPRGLFRELRRKIDPHLSYPAFAKAAIDARRMVTCLDEVNELYYRICGISKDPASCKAAYQTFLKAMYAAQDRNAIEQGYEDAMTVLQSAELKPERPLRVGLIGEYFTVMDPPSNLFLEQKLADMGVSVERWMNLSGVHMKHATRNMQVGIKDLMRYRMGPTTVETLWCARKWAQDGFDGLIHVKSAGCTPEIDNMALLQQLAQEYHIPVLYLSFDTQTGDVGLQTRLEAFYDMIAMKR